MPRLPSELGSALSDPFRWGSPRLFADASPTPNGEEGIPAATSTGDETGPGLLPDEESQWLAAMRTFQLGLYERASQSFAAFASQFPNSPRQAQALNWAAFARGEEALVQNQFFTALTIFDALEREPDLSAEQQLAVATRGAFARLQFGDADGAFSRLLREQGPFRQALDHLEAGREMGGVAAGLLILAEAAWRSGNVVAALNWADRAFSASKHPQDLWEVLSIQLKAFLEQEKFEEALQVAEQMRVLCLQEELADRMPLALSGQAEALRRGGKRPELRRVLQEILRLDGIGNWKHRAVRELTELDREEGRLAEARIRLETYLSAQPDAPRQEPLRLLLGSLLLQIYREVPASATLGAPSGLLAAALSQLDTALASAGSGDLRGRIQFVRGWCLWEQTQSGDPVLSGADRMERMKAAETAFRESELLLTEDPVKQVVSQLKQADLAHARGSDSEALTQYLAVAMASETERSDPSRTSDSRESDRQERRGLRNGDSKLAALDSDAAIPADDATEFPWWEAFPDLVQYAWQQTAVLAVGLTNSAVAERAVRELLRVSQSSSGDLPEVLLIGQTFTRRGDGKRGRDLLARFVDQFPDSPLRADASLLIATSWMRERAWTHALQTLGAWIEKYPEHPSRVRAEFDKAWVQAQMGETEKAVEAFRALASQHAHNPLSLMAQLWLGDHFFGQGDFQRSEQAYSMVSTNRAWAGGGVPHKARLLAAEAAIRGQRHGNARDYLLNLLNDKDTPQELLPSAYFALGNLNMLEITARRGSGLDGYNDALDAFRRVTLFTNTPLVAAAWGRMAECHFQLGTQNPVNYDRATVLFQRVVDHAVADVSTRAKAKVGLGKVAEKRAALLQGVAAQDVLNEAVNHHLDVLTGKVLRAGEVADSWWVREAGMEAARLMEQMGRWREAVAVYTELGQSVPESRSVWEARRLRAQSRLRESDI